MYYSFLLFFTFIMGCSAPVVIEDQNGVNVEDLINQKRTTIMKYEESKQSPDENDLTLMVRLDIDIAEQIEGLNKTLEKKNNKKLRQKVKLLVQDFNELIVRWKNVIKDGKEEEELRREDEENKEHMQIEQ